MQSDFRYVYVLFSLSDRRLYVGYSQDLKNRIKEHFSGKVESTKNRKPLILIHYEAFRNQKDAKAREKFLKSRFGRSQLKRALQNDLKKLDYKNL